MITRLQLSDYQLTPEQLDNTSAVLEGQWSKIMAFLVM